MNFLRTLFLLAAGLSVACCGPIVSSEIQSLVNFRFQILCMMPDSWPIKDYADYGCYCGKGGSGKPVDELDRCCEVHDNCYGDAMKHDVCNSYFAPYFKSYSHDCAKHSKTITCGKNNSVCEQFLCECDRKAAECFARSPYNDKYKHLPSDQCQ
ncbi:phospholipase A2 isoform X2 [Pleuronectes platessa]|uniref:phospholipase A2 isoform X2 n=1 Tax=Pleuronectes platessa TaxID=8262 RepID=UPI00232A4A3E|nr:phospholipase A2 isoform X2 [Pleuronectes platessa]